MAVGVVDDRLLFVVSESLAVLTVPKAGGRGEIGTRRARSTWVHCDCWGKLICQIFFIENWRTAKLARVGTWVQVRAGVGSGDRTCCDQRREI